MLISNPFIDKKNTLIVLLEAFVAILLFTNLSQCGEPCNEVSHTDTLIVYRDTGYKLVVDNKPTQKLISVKPRANVRKADILKLRSDQQPIQNGEDSTIITEPLIIGGLRLDSILKPRYPILSPFEDSLRYYRDTFTENYTKAVIEETVQGEILNRKVWLANTKPDLVIKETVVRKERLKLYVGAQVIIPNNLKRWGIAPSIQLAIPKIGAISYGYDIRNQAHIGGIYALIRIKK